MIIGWCKIRPLFESSWNIRKKKYRDLMQQYLKHAELKCSSPNNYSLKDGRKVVENNGDYFVD
jgi:hypothetical protein